MFLAQLRNELWKLFGKKRTYIGFGAFLLAQVLMLMLFRLVKMDQGLGRMLSGNGYSAESFISALTVAVIMLIPQVGLLMPLYAALVGGDLVAKEAEDGTLRMILARPISRLRLLFTKWLSGVFFAFLLAIALGAVALLIARILFPWQGLAVVIPGPTSIFGVFDVAEGFQRFAFSMLFTSMNAMTMLSVAFMFSCMNVKPAAATILALTFLIVSFVLEQIPLLDAYDNYFITHHFACWLLIFQSPTPWSRVIESEIILVAVNITAFIVGAMAFQVRDIKS